MEHAKIHSQAAAQYKCATCGMTFKTQAELMEHAKIHKR